jgi:hypothetical protein
MQSTYDQCFIGEGHGGAGTNFVIFFNKKIGIFFFGSSVNSTNIANLLEHEQ